MPTPKSGVPDYIWISKWETFQHYVPKRDVPPAWIKTYPKQLSDDRYLDLTAAQRAILHDLRCEFATSAGRLLNDTRRLSQRTGLRITNAQLEALNHAGFIEFLSRAALDTALEEFYASRVPTPSQESEPEPELEKDSGNHPDQKRTETTSPAGLDQLDVRETLEELGARLASRAAPVGSEGRLFEVLPDMDEGSPAVLRALLDTLPAQTIEQVREEIITNKPRKPTAYAVDLLKKQQGRRGRTAKEATAV